jgi:hypothetical protein
MYEQLSMDERVAFLRNRLKQIEQSLFARETELEEWEDILKAVTTNGDREVVQTNIDELEAAIRFDNLRCATIKEKLRGFNVEADTPEA